MLKFQVLPQGKGFHLEHSTLCESASSVYQSGGTTRFDENGWMLVDAGTALVLDDVPLERIGNGGSSPVEVLRIGLLLPEIDPVTGQPVGDRLVTGRSGNPERQRKRRECRLASNAVANEAAATPGGATMTANDTAMPPAPKDCRG